MTNQFIVLFNGSHSLHLLRLHYFFRHSLFYPSEKTIISFIKKFCNLVRETITRTIAPNPTGPTNKHEQGNNVLLDSELIDYSDS